VDSTPIDMAWPGHEPQRLRGRAWAVAGPIACGCAMAAAAAYVAAVDPTASGTHLPACPLYALTGLWCPGCGLTRATHAALRGHLGAAFGYNLFFPVFIAAIALAWFEWLRGSLRRRPLRLLTRLPLWAPLALGVVFIAYGVLRNIPALHVLAP
jgi:hypothetical protein